MAKERNIPYELEEPRYGINTFDSPKKLLQHFSQQLSNSFPGISVKPRNGITEEMLETGALGYGSVHTYFRPEYVTIEKDGNLFIIVWHYNIGDPTRHGIEVWNISDGLRTVLDLGKFNATEIHVTFKKLHGDIYLAIEKEFQTNNTSAYRTKNKILEYIDGAWVVREMGIDISPQIQNIYTVPSAEDSGLWGGRAYYGGVVWNNEIWIVGGLNDTGALNSVIHSSDGNRWTTEVVAVLDQTIEGGELVTEDGEQVYEPITMPLRYGFKLIVFDEKLWFFGGTDGTSCFQDIYFTEDGVNWVKSGFDADWDVRKNYGIVEYDSKLWIVGGEEADGTPMSDVWNSTDGITWTEVSQDSGFTARGKHICIVYDSKIWIQGGTGTNIYSSTDGATWTEVAADAGIGTRTYHAACVYDDYMWIVGGLDVATPKNDVYQSTDGITWTLVQGSADWTARYGFELFMFLNDLYLVCGYSGSAYNTDVYYSDDGITWTAFSIGMVTGKYFSYTYTFIRRTDDYAVLADIDDFIYQSWETVNSQQIIGADEELLTGTVSLSGTALTGSGTAFDTELEEGDYLRIDGVPRHYEVTSVTDATNAVVVNTPGDTYSAKSFALLPAEDEYITTNNFMPGECEGVESEDYRRVIYTSTSTGYCRNFIVIPSSAAARAKGATHVRIYRTLQADTQTVAQGLSHRYLVDVALDQQKTYRDNTSDATLVGETNVIEVIGMSAPPSGRFCFWAGGRLWIGGNPDLPGYWFASNSPSNTQYPQKYASLFDLEEEYITCDPDDGQRDTGGFEFLGDSYFCKERKVFRVANSTLDNLVYPISHSIGVAFPNSIAFGVDPENGYPAVFFLSESGPAYLTSGGQVRLMHEFRIAELWPGVSSSILRNSDGSVTDWHTRNKVSGAWWNDSYFLCYGDSNDSECDIDTNVSIGNHYARDGRSFGGFKWEFAIPTGLSNVIFEPQVIVPIDNITAYALSHKTNNSGTNVYRLMKYSDVSDFIDTYTEGTAKIVSKWKPRPFAAAYDRKQFVEAKTLITYVEFDDDEGLVVTISADGSRLVNESTYAQVRQSGVSATGSAGYRLFEAIHLKDGIIGTVFSVLMEKTIPTDGDVEIHCPEIIVLPIERDLEFNSAGATISGLTFVEEADATPEVEV